MNDQGTGNILLLEVRPRPEDRCALAFLSEPRMSWLETLDSRLRAKPAIALRSVWHSETPRVKETLRITDEVAD
jgi:hypothetical protein